MDYDSFDGGRLGIQAVFSLRGFMSQLSSAIQNNIA